MRAPITLILLIPLLALLSAGEGRAKMLLSQEEALSLAFPAGAKVEKKTAFLSREQVRAAQKLARAKVDSHIWTYYVGRSSAGATLGYVYFDQVIIRTLPATVMVSVGPDGRIRFIEILTFSEPEDYLPKRRWLKQFRGRGLDKDLRIQGVIRNVSRATLTAYALTGSARRMLAIHEVLRK